MGSVPAHKSNARPKRRGTVVLTVAIAVVVLALVAGAVVLVTRPSPSSNAAATPPPQVVPLDVVGTSPAANATGIAPSTAVTVALSAPLATDSPMPTISPAIPGSWSALSPSELQFVSTGPLVPGSHETITVLGGSVGPVSDQGQHLASTVTIPFSVAQGSTLRLQQLLAQLGYLPLSFTPATQPSSPQQEADPQQGTFNWRWADQPPSLTSLWNPNSYNVITKGAIMSFEDQHGLTTDGLAGPQVWADVLQAAESGASDPNSYDYVYVQRTPEPESVSVYQNGALTYETPANTGVAAAPTASGTFPVYVRYQVTTMRGTNPDGSKYVDPGIPWVSYFNGGDALHGYVRGGYGYPQSDGCVEMPPANAAVVYPKTPIGTLVTVQ
jgi:peptidoglycan hydrolase-like protein with peptidoglycan-binding domain